MQDGTNDVENTNGLMCSFDWGNHLGTTNRQRIRLCPFQQSCKSLFKPNQTQSEIIHRMTTVFDKVNDFAVHNPPTFAYKEISHFKVPKDHRGLKILPNSKSTPQFYSAALDYMNKFKPLCLL